MQNEKENRYVFEMTLDYDDLVRDLGASNATLLMRAYLVRENYNNNTTLDGDAVFHETTVSVKKLTQQTGEPLFSFEIVMPRQAVDDLGIATGNATSELFTGGLLLYPMVEIDGGANDGSVVGYNLNRYQPRITGVVHNVGGLHMRLVTKRVADVNQVESYYGKASATVAANYTCQENADCSAGWCNDGQCSDTVVEPGRLQANIYGLTFDDAEAWPSSNTARVDEIMGWNGVVNFDDGTQIYVVNGLNGRHSEKTPVAASTLAQADGVLFLGDHGEAVEVMKQAVFGQSTVQSNT